ncbi:MAG: hypothetical protein QM820_59620 [Minicystis sp.]
MPKQRVLLTFCDMIAGHPGITISMKLQSRHDPDLTIVMLDGPRGLAEAQAKLDQALDVPPNEQVKIYILGHGNVGTDSICNNANDQRVTLSQLAECLAVPRMVSRSQSAVRCHLTTVSMISCLFGRTADGNRGSSAAAKLHLLLGEHLVYVTLEARTQIVKANHAPLGHFSTVPQVLHAFEKAAEEFEKSIKAAPVLPKSLGARRSKVPYTKVRLSWQPSGQRVYELVSYGMGSNLDLRSLEGRQYLWADWVAPRLSEMLAPEIAFGRVADEEHGFHHGHVPTKLVSLFYECLIDYEVRGHTPTALYKDPCAVSTESLSWKQSMDLKSMLFWYPSS